MVRLHKCNQCIPMYNLQKNPLKQAPSHGDEERRRRCLKKKPNSEFWYSQVCYAQSAEGSGVWLYFK